MATEARHTVSAFDEELDALREMILELGARASSAAADAVEALRTRDVARARAIAEADKAIDALAARAEAAAVHVVALRAPMADDLRTLVAAIKISALLERTADYAKNIARRVASIEDGYPAGIDEILTEMAQAAGALLDDVVRAYATGDAALAREVCERDEAVDALHDRLTAQLIDCMIDKPSRIGQAAHLLFVGKHVERIGDQATNIAEMVIYAATGAQPEPRDTARLAA